MKKKLLIIFLIIFILIGTRITYHYYRITTAKKIVVLKKEKVVEVYSKAKISEFIESINGKLENDEYVDTTEVGKHIEKFTYTNDDNIEVEYSFEIKVVDTTPPVVGVSSKTITTDYDGKLAYEFFCGDNYDDKPKCKIVGDYDTTKVGKYDLIYIAKDSSKNETRRKFTLTVKEPIKTKEKEKISTDTVYKKYEDIVKEYKNKNTKIGVDLSYWQKDINFKKLKKSGVEFAFIRVGSENKDGFFADKKFDEYMKGLKDNKIPVGVYYYSYADSKEQAKKEAKWVLKHIKKYDIDLPVVFDWENWDHYREYNLSFHSLTEVAETFLSTIEDAGYEGMLYSSKYYLEEIWYPTKYKKWLAHYTKQTNYQGKYKVWQICSNGKIDGIPDSLVDIDIMYK